MICYIILTQFKQLEHYLVILASHQDLMGSHFCLITMAGMNGYSSLLSHFPSENLAPAFEGLT